METDPSAASNKDNTFRAERHEDLQLLKSAVIYGPNASGKTNVIRAFYSFCRFIVNSTDLKLGDPIEFYEAFKLDKACIGAPTHFKASFLGNDHIKYQYAISFNEKSVLTEVLSYYPESAEINLFARTSERPQIELGEGFVDKSIKTKVIENRLFLSEAANNIGDEQMAEIYRYFKQVEFWSILSNRNMQVLRREISETYAGNKILTNRLARLIKLCDTKIDAVSITKRDENEFKFPDDLSDKIKTAFIEQHGYSIKTAHRVYESDKAVSTDYFDFEEGSAGTRILYALGGLILKKLETGGVIFFDEFNSSLHPKLCRFLVGLLHHPKTNPLNTQLIFATHETTLLDNSLFRKDQIWFTETNKYGETELYSAGDFEGVQDDAPFHKWYMSGKFDAQPHIKELAFIYEDEQCHGT